MNIEKKSYAKVNIFLKIVGKRDNYHLLASRFVRVKSLYDIVKFKSGVYDTITIEGKFSCTINQNTIYKAYISLCEISDEVKKYFSTHKVIIEKKIPEFAGLGGGSSNCATFILLVNDVCNLNLSKKQMAHIGLKIGADVPFFIYEYDSANVSGIGEIVEEFKEKKLNIQTYTPNIKCNTKNIFTIFRDKFYKELSICEQTKLFQTKSIDIYNTYEIEYANDLYECALYLDNNLKTNYLNIHNKSFFSGSGSSFFTIL